MRYLLISDIHGNLNALKAVWSDITRRRTDHVLFLGDLVAFGPKPLKTVQFFKDNVDASVMLRGNTDRYLLERVWEKDDCDLPGPIQESLAWTAKKLGKRGLSFLENLTDETSITVEDVTLLLCHASPGSDELGITSDTVGSMTKAFKGVKADLVLCGHTHIPLRTSINGTDVINVGSVGFPFDRDLRACYLSFFVGDGQIRELTVARHSYPTPGTIRQLEETNMPSSNLFVHRLKTGTGDAPRA